MKWFWCHTYGMSLNGSSLYQASWKLLFLSQTVGVGYFFTSNISCLFVAMSLTWTITCFVELFYKNTLYPMVMTSAAYANLQSTVPCRCQNCWYDGIHGHISQPPVYAPLAILCICQHRYRTQYIMMQSELQVRLTATCTHHDLFRLWRQAIRQVLQTHMHVQHLLQ